MADASDQSAKGGPWNRFQGAFAILVLATVYYLSGKFGLSLASINASASAVWPPTGIALAALLLWGRQLWPGVFLGAFLVNITTQGSVATTFGIAVGNTVEALLGAALVGRFAGGASAFERVEDVFRFAGLAALLSPTPSATLGVTSLCLGGYAHWGQYGAIWTTWWLGDMVSNLIVAPVLLIWKVQGFPRLGAKQWAEAMLLIGLLVVAGYLLFLGKAAARGDHAPLGFLTIPPLLWAALRFGGRGASLSVLVMSGMALWGTLRGAGPFVSPAANDSLLFVQAFMGTSSLTALALAGLLSEQSRAEATLRASRQELAAILASAMDAIITIDEDQRVMMFNAAAERMFGLPAGQALGTSIDRFIPAHFRDRHRHHIQHFGETGRTPRAMGHLGALSALRADGTEFPIEASISRVVVGERRFYSVILRDITERKRVEEALRQARDELAQANAELERRVQERTAKLREMVAELEHFSYAIVHDMRAPLRAMQGFAAMTEEALGEHPSPEVLGYLHRIRIASERMDALVLDALSYNRAVLEDVPLEPVDLAVLVPGIIETYPNLQPPKAKIRIEGRLPLVRGNKAGLTQCFSNLLGNAVKFVAPGVESQVRLWAETRPGTSEPQAERTLPMAGGLVARLWVEDNGIGIPKEWHRRIFDMFQRVEARYEGTGIGLAIVRKTVERMGGRVGVESTPGKGSRFWIELLLEEPAPPAGADRTV